ncbi:MAG: hypothetical protein U1F77_01575 [Kiritimatiellia bacterium]
MPPKTRDLRSPRPSPTTSCWPSRRSCPRWRRATPIQLPLAAGNDLQIIDSLGKMFDYLQALAQGRHADQYRFILGWGRFPRSWRKPALNSNTSPASRPSCTARTAPSSTASCGPTSPTNAAQDLPRPLDARRGSHALPRTHGLPARLNTVEQILSPSACRRPADTVRRIADQVERRPKDPRGGISALTPR